MTGSMWCVQEQNLRERVCVCVCVLAQSCVCAEVGESCRAGSRCHLRDLAVQSLLSNWCVYVLGLASYRARRSDNGW
jgi:hypothetical protein